SYSLVSGNHAFIDLPKGIKPKQPCFSSDVVTKIIAGARKDKYQLLFALCAGTGLRFGEALGIQVQHVSQDGSTIKIVQKAWRSEIHDFLKTDSGTREVDLCPSLAVLLKGYLERCVGEAQVRPAIPIKVGQAPPPVKCPSQDSSPNSAKSQSAHVWLSRFSPLLRYASSKKRRP